MSDFFDNIDFFKGDGSVNRQNQSFDTFIEGYDANKFEKASNTVDTLVFSYKGVYKSKEARYRLLMVKRSNHPCIGYWALPGGFLEMNESQEEAAKRELEEETSIKNLPVQQLRSWSQVNRDPRTRIITTSFMAVVEDGSVKEKAGDDAADAAWFDIHCSMEDESTSEDGTYAIQTYVLKMSSTIKAVELNARVVRKYNKKSIVKEEEYSVLESNLLAGDHSMLIVQALLELGLIQD